MGNFKSQKELVNAIASNIDQLESGQLSISQLENHMNDVRELYERTIVLRYKIFENKAEVPVSNTVTAHTQQEDTNDEVEEKIVEVEILDETPTIDFSLFDDSNEEEDAEVKSAIEEDVIEEDVIESPTPEVKIEEIKVETPIQTNSSNSSEFNRRFADIASQTAGQFGFSKLDTLTGAFGLNERLQYINELFEGSSDVFSEAIKSLDTMPSLDSAKAKAAQLATTNNWDLESDTVEEFIQKLCRRYA